MSTFVVHPRLAGHGPTLFAGISKHVDLRLVSRLEFGSGAVTMRYEPRRWPLGLLARVGRIMEQLGPGLPIHSDAIFIVYKRRFAISRFLISAEAPEPSRSAPRRQVNALELPETAGDRVLWRRASQSNNRLGPARPMSELGHSSTP